MSSSTLPKVLYFTSPHCSACKAMSPSVKETAARFANRVNFAHTDVSGDRRTAAKHMVYGVPTLVAVVDGKVLGRSTGSCAPEQLDDFFDGVQRGEVTRARLTSGERAFRLAVAAAIAGIGVVSGELVVVFGALGFVAYAFVDRLPRLRH